MLSRVTTILLLLTGTCIEAFKYKTPKFVKPGMPSDIFPDPEFDSNAPFCVHREPCGFYSFSQAARTGSNMEWVKSWCRCPSDFDCVYSSTNIRRRMFQHVCIRKLLSDIDDFDN